MSVLAGRRTIGPQRGIGLVGAIFLVTVVAVISVAISRSVATSGETHALELLSARAFMAAEAGAQLAVREVLPAAGAAVCVDRARPLAAVGLTGCQAVTRCVETVVAAQSFYTIESDGRCSDGAALVAERHLRIKTRP